MSSRRASRKAKPSKKKAESEDPSNDNSALPSDGEEGKGDDPQQEDDGDDDNNNDDIETQSNAGGDMEEEEKAPPKKQPKRKSHPRAEPIQEDEEDEKKKQLPIYGLMGDDDSLEQNDNWRVSHVDSKYVTASSLVADKVVQHVYTFDLPSQVGAAHAMLAEINAGRQLEDLYHPDHWEKEPRYHATFPCPMLPLYTPDDVKPTQTIEFTSHLSNASSYENVMDYANCNNKSVPLLSAEGLLTSSRILDDPTPGARYHCIPLHVECKSAVNQLPCSVTLQLEVRDASCATCTEAEERQEECKCPAFNKLATPVPNVHTVASRTQSKKEACYETYTTIEARTDRSEAPDQEFKCMWSAAHHMSNPERARWALVDAKAELARLETPDDNQYKVSRDPVHDKKSGVGGKAGKKPPPTVPVLIAEGRYNLDGYVTKAKVPLLPQPTGLVQWLATTYSHALYSVCVGHKLQVPVVEKNDKQELSVLVPLAALHAVIESYAAHYGPHTYAANNTLWQVRATPTDLQSLHVACAQQFKDGLCSARVGATLRVTYVLFPTADNWLDELRELKARKHQVELGSLEHSSDSSEYEDLNPSHPAFMQEAPCCTQNNARYVGVAKCHKLALEELAKKKKPLAKQPLCGPGGCNNKECVECKKDDNDVCPLPGKDCEKQNFKDGSCDAHKLRGVPRIADITKKQRIEKMQQQANRSAAALPVKPVQPAPRAHAWMDQDLLQQRAAAFDPKVTHPAATKGRGQTSVIAEW